MSDFEWPEDLASFVHEYYLQPHSGGSESPFNRQSKSYGLSAPRWVCRMSLRGGYDGTTGTASFGPRIDALLAKLKGRENRVSIPDFRRTALRGAGVSSNAAAAAGAVSMALTGDPLSVLARKGDYIGGDGRSHLLAEDVVSDNAGNATAYFEPPLARPIAAGAAVYGAPRSWFKLVDDDAGANGTEVGGLSTYSLEFVEDLTWISTAHRMSAAAFAAELGFTDDFLAIDATTSSTERGVVKKLAGVVTEQSIEDFYGITPTFDSGTWPERTLLAEAADGLAIEAADFAMTLPFVYVERLYRAADVDNVALYVANAANTQRLSVGTVSPGTDTGKMQITATTTGTTMNVAGYGLDNNGDGEETHFTFAYLFTSDRMAICINGEEVTNFNTEVQNLSTLANITLFTPGLIAPANGSEQYIAQQLVALVDSDFDDSDLRRLCARSSNPNVADILTLQHYGELHASNSNMPRQPVVRKLLETEENFVGLAYWFVASNTANDYAEAPAEIRVRTITASKREGLAATGPSTVFDQPTGFPTSGGALGPPIVLVPSFGADEGKAIAVYGFPADGPLVQKTSTDNGLTWSARSAALALPGGYTSIYLSGNGSSYEVPASHATHPGRIYFPVYGNAGMRLAYRDPNGTFGSTGSITGLPVGQFALETNIDVLPNGSMVMASRVAASWGGANTQNKRIISTMAVGGANPVYATTLDGTAGFEGAAAAGSMAQLDPDGDYGDEGRIALFNCLTNISAPVRHGGPRLTLLGDDYEIVWARNLMSRWAIRGAMDYRALPLWGEGWFIGAHERSLDSGNGNSSTYAAIFRADLPLEV